MLVDYGHHQEVVFVEELGDFVFTDAFMTPDKRFLGQGQHGSRGLREDDLGQGHGSDQGSVGVDQVDGADGFYSAFEVAHGIDCVLDSGRDWQRQELGGHATGGGCFSVFEEFDNFLALFGLHLHQDLFGAIF